MKGGLENMGLTCGINTLVQCLCHSRYIVATLSKIDPPQGTLTFELKQVVQMLNSGASIRPAGLLHAIYSIFKDRITFMEQHDLCELYTLIAERIATETGLPMPEPKTQRDRALFNQNNGKYSLWNDTVQGIAMSVTACSDCSKIHKNQEVLLTLHLEVPYDSVEPINLSQLLRQAFAIESLTDYKCDKCKNTNCKKQYYIETFPKVLMIILKRTHTSCINGEIVMRKTTRPVDILTDITIDGISYSLIATGNHYGNYNGGHYTATCREGQSWIEYDDTSRHAVSFKPNHNTDAYLLMYEQT